jgi:hypothetical protein
VLCLVFVYIWGLCPRPRLQGTCCSGCAAPGVIVCLSVRSIPLASSCGLWIVSSRAKQIQNGRKQGTLGKICRGRAFYGQTSHDWATTPSHECATIMRMVCVARIILARVKEKPNMAQKIESMYPTATVCIYVYTCPPMDNNAFHVNTTTTSFYQSSAIRCEPPTHRDPMSTAAARPPLPFCSFVFLRSFTLPLLRLRSNFVWNLFATATTCTEAAGAGGLSSRTVGPGTGRRRGRW